MSDILAKTLPHFQFCPLGGLRYPLLTRVRALRQRRTRLCSSPKGFRRKRETGAVYRRKDLSQRKIE